MRSLKRFIAQILVVGIACINLPFNANAFEPPNDADHVEQMVSDGSPEAIPDEMMAQYEAMNQDPADYGDDDTTGGPGEDEGDYDYGDGDATNSGNEPEDDPIEYPGDNQGDPAPGDDEMPMPDTSAALADLTAQFTAMGFQHIDLADYTSMITDGLMSVEDVIHQAIADELSEFALQRDIMMADYMSYADEVADGSKSLEDAKMAMIEDEGDYAVMMAYESFSGSWLYVPGLNLDHNILDGWAAFAAAVMGGASFYTTLFAAAPPDPGGLFDPFDASDAGTRIEEVLNHWVKKNWTGSTFGATALRALAQKFVDMKLKPKLTDIVSQLPVDGQITPSIDGRDLVLTFNALVGGTLIQNVQIRLSKDGGRHVEIALEIGPLSIVYYSHSGEEITPEVVAVTLGGSVGTTTANLLSALISALGLSISLSDLLAYAGLGGGADPEDVGGADPGDVGGADPGDVGGADPGDVGGGADPGDIAGYGEDYGEMMGGY